MDTQKLADLLFPEVRERPEDLEARFPARDLPQGAMVVRLGPSPTGFVHIGNLYVGLINDRLASQSDGIFFLRIEDTDDKRKVEGAEDLILSSLHHFGLDFDEGRTLEGDKGAYGPYRQSERVPIYHVMAKDLVAKGLAYPSFASPEDLDAVRQKQEAQKALPGYYGTWATDRNLSFDEIADRLARGQEWTLRLKSRALPGGIQVADAIRGNVSVPANVQDVVLLKTNGVPTYHFAHVVDDHFMRVTHVVRGEEWLATLPYHVELFDMIGWPLPTYCHTAHLMKIDTTGKRRKLSKRHDPEMALTYYNQEGFFPEAVREYLMILINSDYEEWRLANPEAPLTDFPVTLDKMATSGALYDMVKLEDVSKETLLRMDINRITDFFMAWAKEHRPEDYSVLEGREEEVKALLAIGRDDPKPRKDLVYGAQILDHIRYYFDAWFQIEDALPPEVSPDQAKAILADYLKSYDPADDNSAWFGKIRDISQAHGYALKPKDYKKNPEAYKGHVGHVSTVVRLAVTGKTASPDLWTLQQIMGEDQVRRRIADYQKIL